MASEETAPSAVTNNPPEVAPGIPAVEVDPTNELLDGENLDEKKALIENEPVHVDPSGTRLEHDDAAAAREAGEDPNLVIPPPASANLELRKRTEKLVSAMYESIGVDPNEAADSAAEVRKASTAKKSAPTGRSSKPKATS